MANVVLDNFVKSLHMLHMKIKLLVSDHDSQRYGPVVYIAMYKANFPQSTNIEKDGPVVYIAMYKGNFPQSINRES